MTGRQPCPTTAIVVAIEGIALAHPALFWAAREAALRRSPLVVVHAYGDRRQLDRYDAELSGAAGHDVGETEESRRTSGNEGPEPTARARAWRVAEAGAASATSMVPEVEAHALAVHGPVSEMLWQAVPDPTLVVVGVRGRGVLSALLRAADAATDAGIEPRPVVLARRGSRSGLPVLDGHVVLGVDDSARSEAVIRFGFAAAALRGARLLAVPVPPRGDVWWARHHNTALHGMSAPGLEAVEAILEPHAAEHPGVDVTVAHGDGTVAGPLRIARHPDLLVVGSRGGRGISGLLGSTLGCTAINRAYCPVALVPVPSRVDLEDDVPVDLSRPWAEPVPSWQEERLGGTDTVPPAGRAASLAPPGVRR